ncbi:MAG: magnesium transporter [Candidatus Methylacidiphilales bacterium]|nr:magnesium transporter [Candidatus Methylacidiphilales bacterium]
MDIPLKIGALVRDEIHELIGQKNFTALRHVFQEWPPADLAALITDLPPDDQAVVFRILPRELAAHTFDFLEFDDQRYLLDSLRQDQVADILNGMSPDDRTLLLEELPAEASKKLIALLSPEERKVTLSLLGYPEGSVGRLTTPDYVSAHPDWTVQETLNHIRIRGQDKETLSVIYVLDESGRLIDDVQTRKLLLAPLDTRVRDLIEPHRLSLFAGDDRETAISLFQTHGLYALPVTDSGGKMIGIVTIDDVLEMAEKRATRDIQKMGGSEALEAPYMDIGFIPMIRKRAGWLVVLFLGEMLTATAMGYFDEEIAKAVVLALFVPLIISSGGNSGSQASTLIIRALALGEVTLRDWWRIMRREIAAGLALGTILGGIGFLRITLWSQFSPIYGEHWLLVAITVSLSLIGVVLWGTLAGSMLPLVLRRFGVDPATSSAPFVATLVDVTGLIIYFYTAFWILRGTLL